MTKLKYADAIAYFNQHCVDHNCKAIIRTNRKMQVELWFKREGHALSEFYGYAHDVQDALPK